MVPPAAASISVSTSVSELAVRPNPRANSSWRNSVELMMSPLWPIASGPCIVSTMNGCVLRIVEPPVVEYRVWPIAW